MFTQDESPQPDGINDSDNSYLGDVESLSCDSAEPMSDSEDGLSEMFSKGNCQRAASLRLEAARRQHNKAVRESSNAEWISKWCNIR